MGMGERVLVLVYLVRGTRYELPKQASNIHVHVHVLIHVLIHVGCFAVLWLWTVVCGMLCSRGVHSSYSLYVGGWEIHYRLQVHVGRCTCTSIGILQVNVFIYMRKNCTASYVIFVHSYIYMNVHVLAALSNENSFVCL